MANKSIQKRPAGASATHVEDKSTRSVSRSVAIERQEFHCGPIPRPDDLAQYNAIIPNGADRIMVMAEKQSLHRMDLERITISGNVKSQSLGQHYAFIICMTAIVLGFVLVMLGKDASGLATILTTMVGGAGLFVYTKHAQLKERKEKATALGATLPKTKNSARL